MSTVARSVAGMVETSIINIDENGNASVEDLVEGQDYSHVVMATHTTALTMACIGANGRFDIDDYKNALYSIAMSDIRKMPETEKVCLGIGYLNGLAMAVMATNHHGGLTPNQANYYPDRYSKNMALAAQALIAFIETL